MGPVSMFTYIIFEPLFIRLDNKFEAKASKSPEVAREWWKLAQLVWNIGQSITSTKDDPEYIQWTQNMIDLDIRLREIVQREDFLINQCQKAEELLDDPKKRQQQLDEWHIELRNLEQSYWNVERMLYANDLLCPLKTVYEGEDAVVELADAARSHVAPPVLMAVDIVQKCAVAVSRLGAFP
ncbi:hypothetical protein PENSOL_c014G02185 [Penicillium solitum]|uniref:Uncharacterized protein n=1 Tax=Penicillium solitum TaxID=60172 RepID=A0A1V6R614_9EURO|nr:uncharacterized protein PENSOL_c014G02185 [Penicillium solitum]OQD96984.1 hypothetical protein PENSOL_c014G02185 [Penicillium solitum]